MNIYSTYHTHGKSQTFNKNKSLFNPDVVYDFTQIVTDNYINTLTRCGKNIARVIKQFSRHEFTELKISTIAKMARCSPRTVSTFINKFNRDGFIPKSQKNPFAPNVFKQNCVHYKSSSLIDSLFSINIVGHTRPFLKKMIRRISKRGNKMNEIQKEMILNQRNHPQIRQLLNAPSIQNHIFTPISEKIITTLNLNEKERYKLTVFDDETLEHIYEQVKTAISHKKVPHPPYRVEWLMLFGCQYCSENDIKPDWKWYYDLCEMLGIEVIKRKDSFNKKSHEPLRISNQESYKPWKKPQEDPIEIRINTLRSEIQKNEERLQHSTQPAFLNSFLERMIREKKQELEELEQKEFIDEKQSILYQYQPSGMA